MYAREASNCHEGLEMAGVLHGCPTTIGDVLGFGFEGGPGGVPGMLGI